MASPEPSLVIPSSLVRRYAPRSPIGAVLRQAWAELRWSLREGTFRIADPEKAVEVYGRMSPEEFDAINARQRWASWRTIPQAMSGRLPARPLTIVDLGAGTGQSTEVLACFSPAGSRILAIEAAAPLVDAARRRQYRHLAFGHGSPANVEFLCASILEPWRWADGQPVPEQSVDFVNSTGVVGHHLKEADVARLLDLVVQALRPGGVAALDPGPAVDHAKLRQLAQDRGLACLAHVRSNPFDRWGQLVFRKG